VAALSDNSTGNSSKALSHHTGEGVVIDIGTGDGRFVYRLARENPAKFYIGIDANTKPLEKISTQATRNPAKGGAPNVIFIRAVVEDLPEELDESADEVHIHFPWGSLLRAVALGDAAVLRSVRRICAPGCLLEIVIGIDPERDRAEIERLEIPDLTPVYLHSYLIPRYIAAGFVFKETGSLASSEWPRLETSWARKLRGGDRRVTYLIFST
jgi:16S rRNA (adenine(1408)-N(1))-methyltransferase